MEELCIKIACALIGALVGYLARKTLIWVTNFRRDVSRFCGDWMESWETCVPSQPTVVEEVRVRLSWWKDAIIIKNVPTPAYNERWTAVCQAFDGNHLAGYYTSDRGSVGAVMLTRSPGGSFIYGRWIGESFHKEDVQGYVLLYKTEADRVNGMEKLKELGFVPDCTEASQE